MLETSNADAPLRVGLVSTFPPTACGIGRFAASLVDALAAVDPSLDIEVIRLKCGQNAHLPRRDVVMEIDPNSPIGIRAASRHLDRGDVAIIQHEFGIFGDDEGSSVLDLLTGVDVPKVVVLHTALPSPNSQQTRIVGSLAEEATIVVLCESAAKVLSERYSVPAEAIQVIRHGAQWPAQPVNHPPRRQLITWGLLGPGKGIERAIAAVGALRNIDPPPRYQIVGRTHPAVASRNGDAYRRHLQDLVDDLGVSDLVAFVDRYVSDNELFNLVRRCDLVIVPYDNDDQVSSGVITEAVGLGRPVVATRFPYSEELLGSGAGVIVDHNAGSIAAAIRGLIEDPIAYRRAVRAASDISEELSWTSIAGQYSRLIHGVAPVLATA
jgi:glycosyltransferase involved in cell wall biosynthesis